MATKEGEFLSTRVQLQKKGEFGRNWKLVEDHKDPRKRVWHLIEVNNGKERIVRKRIGAINIGGNLGTSIERTWKKGQENARRNELLHKQIVEQKKKEGYVFDYGKWVPGPNFDKIQAELKASKSKTETKDTNLEKAVYKDPANEAANDAFKGLEGILTENPNESLYAFADELRANENRQKLNLGEMNKYNPIEETIDFPDLGKAPNLNTEVSEMAFKGTDQAAFDAVRSKIAKDPSRIQEGLMKSGFTADRLAKLVIKNRKFQANKWKKK